MIIYLAINKINGKCYVGQTIHTLKKRKAEHYYEVKSHREKSYFHNALRKYAKDDFTWEIIHECDNKEDLNKWEVYYIGYHDSIEGGYNLLIGGGSASGFKHTEESKRKMCAFQKGKTFSKETKAKISAALKKRYEIKENRPMLGRKHSEETKKKMSEAQKGVVFTEERRKKMSEACKGRVLTEEHKAKLSAAKKGVLKTEETKKRMSIAQKGIKKHPFTEERKLVQSIALKKYWKRKKQEDLECKT